MFRSGTVALVGRANVGKSTFLNTALGEPLAIVSAFPQTTRDTLMVVVTREGAEFALVDSPGIHRPRNELGRRMNLAASDAARKADYALVFIDASRWPKRSRRNHQSPASAKLSPAPRTFASSNRFLQPVPRTIMLNKVDKLHDKSLLLPVLADLGQRFPNVSVIPISSRDRADVDRVLTSIGPQLPESPARFDKDTLTNRPLRFFAAEYIREQIMRTTRGELPFAVAVTIDEFSEQPNAVVIQATISVEKDGQRVILIGHQGQQIRDIGVLCAATHRVSVREEGSP